MKISIVAVLLLVVDETIITNYMERGFFLVTSNSSPGLNSLLFC